MLHGRVGDVLESEPDGPRRHLDLLAYHYSHSDDLPKKRYYLGLAGAAAKAAYAKRPPSPTSKAAAARRAGGAARRVAPARGVARGGGRLGDGRGRRVARPGGSRGGRRRPGVARARVAQAELARKQGRFVEAESELTAAEEAFTAVGDDHGRARVLHLRGTLASQQGHPDQARAAYESASPFARPLATRPASPPCSPTWPWSPRTRETSARPSGSAKRGWRADAPSTTAVR